ncbi:MAG: NHL repeat-containing protein, partial [Thermoanaerobaculia bacterium]
MKKLILILNLLLSLNFYPKNYVYDMHFPQQDPPWYFNANSVADDKKGNLCIGSEKELFFLNPQGQVEKVVPWKTEGLPVFSVSLDEEGNIYGLTYIHIYSYLIKIDPEGNLIKLGPCCVGDFMYLNGFMYGFYANYSTGFTSAAIWDKDFKLIKTFGEFGDQIWVNSSNIFISNRVEKKIKIYNLEGEFLKEFSTEPYEIRAICTDEMENIYGINTSYGQWKVIKYSKDGQYLGGFGETSTEIWKSIEFNEIYYLNERLYFIYNGGVILTDKEGNILEIWSSSGKEEGKFSDPKKIEVSINEKIYVADKGNNRVQIFNKRGKLEKIIGVVEPDTIATDKEGNLFVGSRRLKMIFKFDKDGNFIKSWNLKSPYYDVDNITDIAVDKEGYVYALDGYKNCIAVFENSGEFVKEIQLLYGSGLYLEVDNQKNIILAFSNKVYFYNQEGEKIKELIIDKDVSHEFIDIDVKDEGKIFLLDRFPVNRVLVIDYDGKIIDTFCDGLDIIKDTNYGRSLSIEEDGSVYILDPWRVLRYKTKHKLPQTIPASASTIGVNGTHWRTDLSIFNPSDQSIDIKLNYFSNFGNKEIDLSLGGYGFLSLKDVVENTFGMPETFGAIEAICLNESQPILFSRTYTESVKGEAWSVNGKYDQFVGAEFIQPEFLGAELAQPDLIGTYGQEVKAINISKFSKGEGYLIDLEENGNY